MVARIHSWFVVVKNGKDWWSNPNPNPNPNPNRNRVIKDIMILLWFQFEKKRQSDKRILWYAWFQFPFQKTRRKAHGHKKSPPSPIPYPNSSLEWGDRARVGCFVPLSSYIWDFAKSPCLFPFQRNVVEKDPKLLNGNVSKTVECGGFLYLFLLFVFVFCSRWGEEKRQGRKQVGLEGPTYLRLAQIARTRAEPQQIVAQGYSHAYSTPFFLSRLQRI